MEWHYFITFKLVQYCIFLILNNIREAYILLYLDSFYLCRKISMDKHKLNWTEGCSFMSSIISNNLFTMTMHLFLRFSELLHRICYYSIVSIHCKNVNWLILYNIHDIFLTPLRMPENREAWHAAVHGITESQTQLNDWTTSLDPMEPVAWSVELWGRNGEPVFHRVSSFCSDWYRPKFRAE